MVHEFNRVNDRIKLNVSTGKSKVMVYYVREYDKVDFGNPHIIRPNAFKCRIKTNEEVLEEIGEF